MEQEIVYCDFRHLTRQSREWFDFLQRKDIDEDTRMSGWPPLEDNRVAGCNYTNVMDPEGTIQHGEPHGLKIHIGEKAFKASSLLIGSLAQTKILTVWNKWKMTPRFTRVLAAELSVYESKAKLQAAEEEWDPLQKVHTLDTEGDPLLILVLEPIAPGRVRTTTGGKGMICLQISA
ncbi:hypothetical protein DFS34DRAFT_311296 [Phlyctochytrium arcticum]|nr:hypothetical protein DFS34DRAFT_311296 [Phlyctochytrium arcticum]